MVSLIGRVVTVDVAEIFETMVTVDWGGTMYPRTSVHHIVNLSSEIMELAFESGS